MDEQVTIGHARGHRRVRAQVLQLGDHVFFGQQRHALAFAGAIAVVLDHGAGHFGMAQPGFDRGHFFQALGVEHCTHGAAIGMAAHDDVLHAKGQHGVLDGRGHTAVHLPVGRHHVAHVAGHEQVARGALGDQLGHDARVGAGNEHGPRALGRGELLEEFFLLGEDLVMKMQKTVNNVLQRCIGGLRLVRGRSRRSQRLFILVTHDSSSWLEQGSFPVRSVARTLARLISHSMNKVPAET
ncbi:MAG: hypothetical protein GAK37_00990 [Pseudomonas sp.]|nr:MAG: hypothetical protein GAK37_00990 [Pseudomonas sp.]